MSKEVAVRTENMPIAAPGELSVEQVLAQVEKIQILMQKAMKKDEHYGVIPGTPKPTLLKAGAEKLCLMFRLDPEYEITERQDGEHLTILSRCTLYHINTGMRMGSGMGSCSTRESKYAYRKSERVCPKCGKDTLIKSKYGGGWVCWAKKGGCDAKFKDGDAAIEGQNTERIANPDIADQYNTILKMANKRSLVAGVLNVTAASDIFTQDMEDLAEARRSMNATGGESDTSGSDPENQEPRTISEAQQNMLRARGRDVLGLDDAGLHELAKVEDLSEIHADAFDALLRAIDARGARLVEPDETFTLDKEIKERRNIEPEKVLQFFNKPDFDSFNFAEYNRAMRMIKARKTQPTPAQTQPSPAFAEAESVTSARSHDVAEPAGNHRPPANQSSRASGPVFISEKQCKRLYAISGGNSQLIADVISRYDYAHVAEIHRSDYDKICKDVDKAAQKPDPEAPNQ